ncbi:phage tail sheath family protein [Hymenobacter volaticus]|uniref:Phage tail sheath subtilisin-like domain-containing protein n=1 Tax=Hymenobacter volaticus TaxID=2932254 RepID=A0ABY4G1T0_9BACT|nr:phage tail sheath C-terminal domain-containing protein [Hymenobacter volaticus]UOQ64827.1 phage tail sheath subtilisin-like domain-containing protein [Hymenobacter volaticus]
MLAPTPAAGAALGLSLSGRPVADSGSFAVNWKNILGTLATTNTFRISVGGKEYVDVNLGAIVVGTQAALATAIKAAIENAYLAKGIAGITVTVSFIGPSAARRLQIQADSNGDVLIRQGNAAGGMTDLAVPLMLGTEQGGLEISGIANLRPAPTGSTIRAAIPGNITLFDGTAQSAFTAVTLESILLSNNTLVPQPVPVNLVTTLAGDMLSKDASPASKNDNSDGIREKLQLVAAAINNFVPPLGHAWPWRAEVWGYRLAIISKNSAADNLASAALAFTTAPAFPAAGFTNNVHYYALGTSGVGPLQILGVAGFDGTPPDSNTYDNAYASLDPEIDLFNLMVLAPVNGAVATVQQLYGNASVFCQKRRAFLLMDPDPAWVSASDAVAGVPGMRIGSVKDYSALFFPEITVSQDGLSKNIGPSGALAGLFARIDSTRGVWKAPAGTEADLRGITGLRQPFTDAENGILNPRAINTIRVFPNGIVNWGARTNQGDDDTPHDYKYIPVRRTALFIEESLYRGLKWVVFEPNDEPLWAQIRLAVGAFMHNLFRQGAFWGVRKNDAYYVKCDSETTTPDDINLGVVNIQIGFRPLKPAEFVVLYLQQMAGNTFV